MSYSKVAYKLRETMENCEKVKFIYGNRTPSVGKPYNCRILSKEKKGLKVLKPKTIMIEFASLIAGNLWLIKNKKGAYLLQTNIGAKNIRIALIEGLPETGERLWYHKVWGNTKTCLCEIPQVASWTKINNFLLELKSSNGIVYICMRT